MSIHFQTRYEVTINNIFNELDFIEIKKFYSIGIVEKNEYTSYTVGK